jgi:AcrR family transcriptional regulator
MQREQAALQPRRRPGGRGAKVKDAVVAATVAELQDGGYDKLSIAAVAARAGVHESSIYRRWKTREGLAMEATFALFATNIAIPDKGSLVEDLTALMTAAARHLESPLGRAAMQFALAMRDDPAINSELHSLWARRFEAFRGVFERATDRGEWPGADPTLLLEAMIGAVYLRVFLLRKPVTPKALRPLVEELLRGRTG